MVAEQQWQSEKLTPFRGISELVAKKKAPAIAQCGRTSICEKSCYLYPLCRMHGDGDEAKFTLHEART